MLFIIAVTIVMFSLNNLEDLMPKVKTQVKVIKSQCSRCNQESTVPEGAGLHFGCSGFKPEVERLYRNKRIDIQGKKGTWEPHWLNGAKEESAVRVPSFIA